jgi:hypothetical protein
VVMTNDWLSKQINKTRWFFNCFVLKHTLELFCLEHNHQRSCLFLKFNFVKIWTCPTMHVTSPYNNCVGQKKFSI